MANTGNRPYLPPPAKSLSARVLLLTIFFVMLGEVLIYAPSAGRFRYEYLRDRLATAHTAVLALLATPDYMVSDSLQLELLQHANAYIVALKRPDGVKLMMHAKQGVPSIDLIDFDFPCWHRTCDNLSAVSMASLDAVGEAMVELLRTM